MTGPLPQSRDSEVPVAGILDPPGSPSETNPSRSATSPRGMRSRHACVSPPMGRSLLIRQEHASGHPRARTRRRRPSHPRKGGKMPPTARCARCRRCREAHQARRGPASRPGAARGATTRSPGSCIGNAPDHHHISRLPDQRQFREDPVRSKPRTRLTRASATHRRCGCLERIGDRRRRVRYAEGVR